MLKLTFLDNKTKRFFKIKDFQLYDYHAAVVTNCVKVPWQGGATFYLEGNRFFFSRRFKHFPEESLALFGLAVKTADDFITDLTEQAVKAFLEMVQHKRNPPLNEFEVLDNLRKIGLTQAADYLHSQI